MSSGRVSSGAFVTTPVTTQLPTAWLPAASVAEQVTVVFPSGKVDPDAGVLRWGNYDRILDVSTAVTGTLFFVPSLDLLESLGEEDNTATPSDGSLGIGSLKGEPQ